MIPLEEWEKGLKTWNNVKKQAETDLAMAEIAIAGINAEIKKYSAETKGENHG